jgi:hypothetical protein
MMSIVRTWVHCHSAFNTENGCDKDGAFTCAYLGYLGQGTLTEGKAQYI